MLESLLTTNAILTAVIVAVLGRILKTICFRNSSSKLRKILLPIILLIAGVTVMVLSTLINGQSNYGDAILQGLVASIFSQFLYDKIRDGKE